MRTRDDGDCDDPFDLQNICFMGANVVSGYGTGVILRTGPKTFFGQLARQIAGRRVPTAFDQGINRFTWLMIRFMLVMVPTVFLINGLTKHDWLEALLFAVAVAVGLTPEMLPMIVTVNLAKGAIAMSSKKVIVKRLNAIQNFGAMDVLCTDKTGTLTQDRIILKRCLDIWGEDSDRVLEYAYLNSHFQSGLKNLLDIAVLEHHELAKALRPDHQFTKIDEIPFDFNRRRLSVLVRRDDGRHLLICKGAVEELFSISTHYEAGAECGRLDPSHLETANRETAELNADGFRVVAVAYKEMPPEQTVYTVADESDLTLLGYIAFLDPPKDSAAEAIADLAKAGVSVKILTGDNDIVTRKICKDVGLKVDRIVLGSEIEHMSDDALAELATTAIVFAKLSPPQKAKIIEALHRKGHVVGYLGDGINDGPALKAADVGISVDTAVDIAKESADIILLEKNLLVLDDGVIEGRRIFANITKYIKMGASSNFGNMFSVLGASIFLPFLPMAPIQVLTNNLLYDFSQTAIPTDNVDEEYLASPTKVGHQQHFQIHDLYRANQLHLRLRHLWYDVVRLQRLDQSVAVPNWMVRRISPDANTDNSHHQDSEDSISGEPREPRPHHDDHHHLRGRDRAAIHLGGLRARVHAAAHALLAIGYGHAADIRNSHASCESLVHTQMGALNPPIPWSRRMTVWVMDGRQRPIARLARGSSQCGHSCKSQGSRIASESRRCITKIRFSTAKLVRGLA